MPTCVLAHRIPAFCTKFLDKVLEERSKELPRRSEEAMTEVELKWDEYNG
jgi:hypothetical protein